MVEATIPRKTSQPSKIRMSEKAYELASDRALIMAAAAILREISRYDANVKKAYRLLLEAEERLGARMEFGDPDGPRTA